MQVTRGTALSAVRYVMREDQCTIGLSAEIKGAKRDGKRETAEGHNNLWDYNTTICGTTSEF